MDPKLYKEAVAVMAKSNTAIRRGIPNVPTKSQAAKMAWIYENLFLKVKAYEKSAFVTSGFRCPKVNKAVGSKPGSLHTYPTDASGICTAGAIDIDSHLPNRKLMLIVRKVLDANRFQFEELILEFPPNGWVHVGFRFNPNGHPYGSKRVFKIP
jgi:hypothetical protein